MTSKQKFKTGDTVRLKSGSPSMTVEAFMDFNKKYECQWFAGAKLQSGYFEEDALELVEEEKTGKK